MLTEITILDNYMSVANVKLSFYDHDRCQYQCEIAILDH